MSDPGDHAQDKTSEERLRALINASSDVVFRMSPDWSEMRQLDGRRFIADTHVADANWIEKYIHPDDRPLVFETIAAAIATKGTFELEHRVLRVDGTLGWTHSRALPVMDSRGEIVEWIGIARDTSASHAALDLAARQQRLYEAILTNTPDLAYVWDLDHRFIYANEGLLKMWGKTWDEAIGRNCRELGYEPWHAEMHDREIEQVKATRQPLRGEVPFNGAFGRRTYDYLLVPVIGASGEVEAVAGTTRDVTERKQLESSLLQAGRRKDEFLATLSHELRNPLAPIRNAVQLLKAHNHADGPVRQARDIIDRQVHHLVRLVDDLLEVSRITLGQVNLHDERVLLIQVLRDAIDAVRPAADVGQHRLIVDQPAEELYLQGDATRLAQVFHNLLDNAVKYTPPGGEIRVLVKHTGSEVAVAIRDTGIGIPADMHERIFELFTRARTDSGIKTSGLGIGLALARQLVELHGGRIAVASAGAGTGSEFTVYLPVAVDVRVEPVPSNPAAPDIKRRRVLVVDDNRDAAMSLAMILDLEASETSVAFSGAEALERLAIFKPEIVLMDIGMPGMDGYEAAQRIRATADGKRVVLVALTGWGQAEDKQKAAKMGFDEHLTKPVDPALLSTVLNLRRGNELEQSVKM